VYNYSYSFGGGGLEEYLLECADESERQVLRRIIAELNEIQHKPIPPRFMVGGAGYTHSIINYERVLKEGLNSYAKRIEQKLNNPETPEKRVYYHALKEVLDAIVDFHAKVLKKTKIKVFEQGLFTKPWSASTSCGIWMAAIRSDVLTSIWGNTLMTTWQKVQLRLPKLRRCLKNYGLM
jgi:hypothetical protein